MEIKMDVVGDLNPNIFLDRFQILMEKESFIYQLINCLVYRFSEHANGFFKMIHLNMVISKTMVNLFNSKESVDYFLPYALETLSFFGFVEAKVINDANYLTSRIKKDGFKSAFHFLEKYCENVSWVLDAAVEAFKELLEIINKMENEDESKVCAS